jgi:hypothetical protein
MATVINFTKALKKKRAEIRKRRWRVLFSEERFFDGRRRFFSYTCYRCNDYIDPGMYFIREVCVWGDDREMFVRTSHTSCPPDDLRPRDDEDEDTDSATRAA